MPHTTAPIGSLIGKTFGRSVRSTTTSACMPGSSEPVVPPNPATRAPSAVAKRITSRVLISRGRPAFPASLRSKTVACCNEIAARICANRSPGATRSSSTPSPGRMSRPISCWIGGGPRPAAISLDGAIVTEAPDAARASTSASSSWERWASVTSSPRSPASAISEITPRSHPFEPAWAWMRRPASRARAHSFASAWTSLDAGTTDPDAMRVAGPARPARRATMSWPVRCPAAPWLVAPE